MSKKILLVFGFACFAIFNGNSQSDYKLAEQDSLALVAFYWATNGPNWTSNQDGFGFDDLTSEWQVTYNGKFNKWFDGPAKDWFGVTVEKRPIGNTLDSTYRVTWLWPVIGRRTDGQNLLDGYVPRAVGLLTDLEQFRVNGNDGFRDELIPDELYHPTLRHFDTEAAWFGGGISDFFRNCIEMRKINIRYNNYDFMPNIDFLGEEGARNLEGGQWFYNSRFSYFYMERIVDFFYSVSPNPMEFSFEARDMFDVGDFQEIVAPVGTSIEMICNDAGSKEEFITYQWFKDGLSKFGKNKKNYEISSVKESDYGLYKTRITNDYVKSYDSNGNYGEVFTKGVRVVPEAVPPELYKATVSNSGRYIDLYFDKDMVGATGFESMEIFADGEAIAIASAEVRGRINREVRIDLAAAIQVGQLVTANYNGTVILDANGGALEAISGLEIENRTGTAPLIAEAETTQDGTGILVDFDYYIDPASLGSAVFQVEGENIYEVASISLLPGEIDETISKSVLLTLESSISDSAEVITVQYLEGGLHGLYSGSVVPSEPLPVNNIVTSDRTAVLIQFEDGSSSLEQVVIRGSWKATPILVYDDGSNGDLSAGDKVWTNLVSLADDDYKWDAYARRTINVTDTISSVDSLGNTVLTLVPGTESIDSLLNENFILEFTIREDETIGDTIFGIYNRDVTFNVKVDAGGQDVYLMGINEDWNTGILMESLGDNIYAYTVPKLTAGDLLTYNYRRGENWENQTPDTRLYSVKNDENIINDEFGVFTNLDEENITSVKVYPNPNSDGQITLEGFGIYNEIKILDSTGKLVAIFSNNRKDILHLDLSQVGKGLYFITALSTTSEKVNTFKILVN